MPYRDPRSERARAMARARHERWREKNRDVCREKSAQFLRDNPEYLPTYHREHKEERAAYVEANRDHINARRRELRRLKKEQKDSSPEQPDDTP